MKTVYCADIIIIIIIITIIIIAFFMVYTMTTPYVDKDITWQLLIVKPMK